jgi:hypothetical protein
MEDVLELSTTEPAASTAVVCVDKTPRHLVGESRAATVDGDTIWTALPAGCRRLV